MFNKCLLGLVVLWCCPGFAFPCDQLPVVLSIIENGLSTFLSIIIECYISLSSSVSFCYMYFGTVLLGAEIAEGITDSRT